MQEYKIILPSKFGILCSVDGVRSQGSPGFWKARRTCTRCAQEELSRASGRSASSSSAIARVVVSGSLVFISCASGYITFIIGVGNKYLSSEAGASKSRSRKFTFYRFLSLLYPFMTRCKINIIIAYQITRCT